MPEDPEQPQQQQQPGEGAGSGADGADPGDQPQPGDGDGEGQNDADDKNKGDDSDGNADGDGQPSHDPEGRGEVMDCPMPESAGDPDTARREIEQEWDEARQQAAQSAKAAGKLPGSLAELLGDAHRHTADWREQLRDFMTATAKNDYTWSRPNRRHIASGLYLPSMHSEAMGSIVLAIDTSGSMSSEDLAAAWAEIRAIADELSPERVIVIQCDTTVTDVAEYDADDLPDTLVTRGRGGTAFSPALARMEDYADAAVALYFTDLHCYDFGTTPNRPMPLMWIVQKNGNEMTPPFGDVVRLDEGGS